MGDTTGISWTDRTFNPWIGCMKVSPGCKHCYAESLVNGRMGRPNLWGPRGTRQVTSGANWKKPLGWNRAAMRSGQSARVFSGSLCDVFEDHAMANAVRPELWALIAETPWLDWQLLTKRPENIVPNLPDDWGEGWPNVWLGASIENNDYVHRADVLRQVPAHIRFISYEPALGPVPNLDLRGIHWLIYGGESGPKFRPHDPQWAREVRDHCRAAGVAFFYKQSAGRRPGTGIALDGRIEHAFPLSRLRVHAGGLLAAVEEDC